MRVLLTGHSGWIGTAITDYLYDQGHELYGISRSAGHHRQLRGLHMGDITSPNLIEAATASFPPCDAIVHGAALIDYDDYNIDISKVNCVGTHNVLHLAHHWKCKKFIYLSSTGVPYSQTAYHISKFYGEKLTESLGRDMITVSLRLGPPIGIDMPVTSILANFINNAIKNKPLQVYGHGTRVSSYADVKDMAIIVDKTLVHLQETQPPLTISGVNIANLTLAYRVKNILNSDSEIHLIDHENAQDGVNLGIVSSRLYDLIKYNPRSIDDSIKEIGEAYRERV